MPSFVPFTNEQLADLEARFVRIAVVTGAPPPMQPHHTKAPEPPWSVVYAAPTMGQSDAFEGAANNERSKPGALRQLARNIVVGISHNGHVTLHQGERGRSDKALQEAWDRLRGDFAGVHLAGQGAIMALMGGEAEEAGKE